MQVSDPAMVVNHDNALHPRRILSDANHLDFTLTPMSTPKDLPEFSYTPLAPKEIRLLWPINKADGLTWSLRAASLDDPNLVFDALSYTWGTQDGTFPMMCNGQTLQVHRNLFSALPYLAMRHGTTEDRPIWIDAVCINQTDQPEKSIHIHRMNNIYRRAETVWVWLGVSSEQDRIPEAIALLPHIARAANRCMEFRDSPSVLRAYSYYPLQGLEPALWTAVLHILSNQWFHRVWVVQEASLAKNLRFLCGSYEIALELLEETLDSPTYLLRVFDSRDEKVDLALYGRQTFAIRSLARARKIDEERKYIFQTLTQFSLGISHAHHCQYAQDRVFGLLGLVNEDDLETNNLLFDTTISIPQLYTEFSALLLTQCDPGHKSGALWHYLNGAFTLYRDTALPSWVPDLHRQSHYFVCDPYSSILGYERPMRTEFLASSRPVSVRKGSQPEEIIFRGSILGEIVYVHPGISRCYSMSIGEKMRYYVDLSIWEETLASQMLSTESTVDGGSGTPLDRYWRIISACPMEKDREDTSYESFQEFRKSMWDLREVLSELHMLDR
jgi:hypothetical protein